MAAVALGTAPSASRPAKRGDYRMIQTRFRPQAYRAPCIAFHRAIRAHHQGVVEANGATMQ